jgi:hypothetical protein
MTDVTPVVVYQREVLFAMNRLGKQIYGGTVSDAEKQHRRAKNRVARAQRKVNRGNR